MSEEVKEAWKNIYGVSIDLVSDYMKSLMTKEEIKLFTYSKLPQNRIDELVNKTRIYFKFDER